jgi:hypothetical protein
VPFANRPYINGVRSRQSGGAIPARHEH